MHDIIHDIIHDLFPPQPVQWEENLVMNTAYYYTCTGEGSFGRVLQAKAEGIVPGMPDRNVVAIKTTKGI